MGAVARRILAENYASVVAAQDMKESLERQDSAALFALLDRRERADRQLREHRARFDEAFEKAAHNITEPGATFTFTLPISAPSGREIQQETHETHARTDYRG